MTYHASYFSKHIEEYLVGNSCVHNSYCLMQIMVLVLDHVCNYTINTDPTHGLERVKREYI